MSATYFNFYKRRIGKDTKEKVTEQVEDAYNKKRLTKKEYDELIKLIDDYYKEEN